MWSRCLLVARFGEAVSQGPVRADSVIYFSYALLQSILTPNTNLSLFLLNLDLCLNLSLTPPLLFLGFSFLFRQIGFLKFMQAGSCTVAVPLGFLVFMSGRVFNAIFSLMCHYYCTVGSRRVRPWLSTSVRLSGSMFLCWFLTDL